MTGWWFGTMEFYDFPYIGNNDPNWLSYFSEGLKPTRMIWENIFRSWKFEGPRLSQVPHRFPMMDRWFSHSLTTSHGSFRCQAQVSHAQLCGRRAQNWCENFEQSALAWISCNTAKGNQHIYIYVYIHLIMIVIIKFSQFLHVVPLKVMILCCQTGFTRAYVNVLLTKWAWLQSGRYIVLVFRLNRSTSTSTLVCKKAAGPHASLAVVTRQGMGQATDHVRKARRSQTNYFGYWPMPSSFHDPWFFQREVSKIVWPSRGSASLSQNWGEYIFTGTLDIYVYIYYYYYYYYITIIWTNLGAQIENQ
jgi:hypothetical protein